MYLRIEQIEKSFGKQRVLHPTSFAVPQGQVLSVLGRSGSGKTTLLKIIAGLEEPDAGEVFLDDSPISSWSPQKRGIVYLYQEPLLFPHLSVRENIGFGLSLRGLKAQDMASRVDEMIRHLELDGQAGKMPDQLSGGQRQRVAFGRALIINPRVLLLDEPFAALDSQTRSQMQQFFKKIANRHQITALFVTHDLKEALIMGDQLAVIRKGEWRLYEDREAFMQDPQTGVQDELAFWDQWRH